MYIGVLEDGSMGPLLDDSMSWPNFTSIGRAEEIVCFAASLMQTNTIQSFFLFSFFAIAFRLASTIIVTCTVCTKLLVLHHPQNLFSAAINAAFFFSIVGKSCEEDWEKKGTRTLDCAPSAEGARMQVNVDNF